MSAFSGQKICGGCGQDLSGGGGFDDGPRGFEHRRWLCAACKVAALTKHLKTLDEAAQGALKILARAGGRDLEADDAAETVRLLGSALNEVHPPPVKERAS